MMRYRWIILMTLLAVTGTLASWLVAQSPSTRPADATTQPAGDPPTDGDPTEVVVARLIYAGNKQGVCFSNAFLTDVAQRTSIRIRTHFASVHLDSPDLFRYPLVVMTGQGAFELSDAEVKSIKTFLDRGGMLVASAGCSDDLWDRSFRKAVVRFAPERKLTPIPMDHALFTTGVYKIEQLVPRKNTPEHALYGLTYGARLGLIYSPLGLNDTASAGGGCCCCGGNELRNARQVNVNIVTYTLTH